MKRLVTYWEGRRLEIVEAVALPGGGQKAGEVVALREGAAFGIDSGEGILSVIRVQLQGKLALPAVDFLRGQRRLVGDVLPSKALVAARSLLICWPSVKDRAKRS